MTFLNPLLLFGCAAVAAPIILHLLSRRTVKRTAWAAMRFLQETVLKHQRRVNIEDLLLLALRCLLLVFLALALARPTLRSAAAGFGQPATAVIAIDNSYSMGATDGVSSRLDKARQAAEQLVDSQPTGSSLALLVVSDVARSVIPVPTTDRNTARKVIRGIRITDRGTDWLAGLRLVSETVRRAADGRKEVDIITDGQASGWRQNEEILALLRDLRGHASVRLVEVGERETRNVGISGLRLAGALPTLSQALRFEVEVTNFGTEDAANVAVNLAADDEPPQDATIIGQLPAGGTRNVSLFAKMRTEGCHTVTARTTPDHLPADDARTVALRVLKEMAVLLVDGGDPAAAPRDAATFFLRNALVPVPANEREKYFLKARVAASGSLDSVKLGDYEAVVLADVARLSDRSLDNLAAFLRRGGGLLVFPGPHTDAGFYNEELHGHRHFLPARLGGAHGDPSLSSNNLGFALQVTHYEHPLAALWNDPAAGTLGSARFYRAYTLEPTPALDHAKAGSDPAGDPQVVLRFADGAPMLMERTWGAGRVLEFASTANTAWNDLPVRPAFVPLLYRALASIVNRRDERLNIPVGGRLVLPVDPDDLGKVAVITPPGPAADSGPARPEPVHARRTIEMAGDAATLQYEDTDLAGPYTVTMPGESTPAYRFAVQPDTRESHLEELGSTQIEQFSPLRVAHWTPALDLKEAADSERRGAEFWLPFALLALACAIGETVLADWFGRSK